MRGLDIVLIRKVVHNPLSDDMLVVFYVVCDVSPRSGDVVEGSRSALQTSKSGSSWPGGETDPSSAWARVIARVGLLV